MNDTRTNRQTDSAERGRAQRLAAAIVAQYVNQLSGRDSQGRRGGAGLQLAPLKSIQPCEGG